MLKNGIFFSIKLQCQIWKGEGLADVVRPRQVVYGFGAENTEEIIRISLLNCFISETFLLFCYSLLGSFLVLSGLYIYLYGKANEPKATTTPGSRDKELQMWPTCGSASEDTISGP